MKKALFFFSLNIYLCTCYGQTQNSCATFGCTAVNSLVINTGYNASTQTTIPVGQKDTNWIVTAMTADMQNAFCNSNTTGPTQPTGVSVSPVSIGQSPFVLQTFPPPWIQSQTYVSCFPLNTLYTRLPPQTSVTNCGMDITRSFFICSSNNEDVTFNLSISTDDNTLNITIDAGTPNAIVLSTGGTSLSPPLIINTTENLSPGTHTLTIQCADEEDINGIYYNLPSGAEAQWNPFGVSIIGTISSTNNVLINSSCTPKLSTCNNWLYLPSQPSAVECGDLDVSGNQITVEALINRTVPYTGGALYAGDVVSKHKDPTDANYLLRPNEAEITTTNGYFITPPICEIELNKTYHVAMVYDGATLKFYRNGFLMSQVAATGDLIQNDWPLRIGYYFAELFNTNFLGYIDEVRIWNVARTQSQIRTYMYTPLPSPPTQTGLLAYYQFNDLTNKQGNAAWNGAIVGAASINQTNPTCANFIADTCCTPLTGTLIGSSVCNGSQPLLTFNTTATTGPFTLTFTDGVDTFTQNNVQNNIAFPISAIPTTTKYVLVSIKDTTGCNPTNITGDTATVIVNTCSLCKGSLGDPVVNITFGNGSNPGQPLSTIVPGASTTLTYVPVIGNPATPTLEDGQYTITNNIPYRSSSPWFSGSPDHTSGNGTGFMAFYNSSQQPGEFYNQTVNNLCGSTTYEFAAWIANAVNPAFYVGVDPNITFIIEQTDGTILATYNTGDIPENSTFTWNHYGFYFTTPSTVSSVVLRMINNNSDIGGGGGNDFALDDITFRACGPTTTASFSQTLSVDTLKVCAASFSTIYGTVSAGYNTPNYLWQQSADSGRTWNDIPNSNSLQLPFAVPSPNLEKLYLYRLLTAEGNNINSPNCRVASNIVALIIEPSPQGELSGQTICNGDNALLSFTASIGTAPFNIVYNVGANIYNQSNIGNNISFTVPFNVTDTTTFNLFSITDANGCTDTVNATTVINVNPLPQGGIVGDTVCAGDSVTIVFNASSGVAPYVIQLSNGTTTNTYYQIQSGASFQIEPTYNTETITLLSVTDHNGNGCTRTTGFTAPTALVTAKGAPQVQFDSLPAVCIQQPPFIFTEAREQNGAYGYGYYQGAGVDSAGNFSPVEAGAGDHYISFTFVALDGCSDSAIRNIMVNPTPVVNAGGDIITCIGFPVTLNATGALTYLWSPPFGLDDATKQSPVATLDTSTTFIVQGTDVNGCVASDTITVNVSTRGINAFQIPNAFTPNGDGHNDCFGIRNWGSDITVQQFSIYNRWGQLVFSTKNPSDCWDGTFKGIAQEPGGYIYIIKATSPCGNLDKKGVVLLIR